MSFFEIALRVIAVPILVLYYAIEGFVKFITPNKYLKVKSVTADDVVLITGAGMGIGQQTAIYFVKNGCRQLVIWDINETGMKETKDILTQMGCKVWTYKVDVTDYDAVKRTAEEVKANVGNVTYLINNAGIVAGKPILQLQPEQVRKVIDVNTVSHFWTVQTFLPGMLRHGGHIITISSIVGHIGAPFLAEYVTSKFGAYGFHCALRMELKELPGGNNVQTTVVCPWAIATGMFDGMKMSDALPYLEPAFVGESIVDAVQANRELLIVPSSVRFFPILQRLLPEKIMDLLYSCVTNISAAETLVTREKAE